MCEKGCRECKSHLIVHPDGSFMCINPEDKGDKLIADFALNYGRANRNIKDVCINPTAFTAKETEPVVS